MSHFLTFVFVSPDEANIEQRVNALVDPYFDNEDREQTAEDQIKCDGFVIGGRRSGNFWRRTHVQTPPPELKNDTESSDQD